MFVALLTSLPTGRSTVRMRVWRSLKSSGCGVLRDGVYLLPTGAAQAKVLEQVESEVRAVGGFAMTVELEPTSPAQLEYLRRLFDRSGEYGALVAKLAAAKRGLARLGGRKADTLVQRLRRAYQALAETDYFPGERGSRRSRLWRRSKRRAQPARSRRAARGKGRVRRLDPARYRRRVWATRSDLWVDRLGERMAGQALHRPDGRFVWLERPARPAEGGHRLRFRWRRIHASRKPRHLRSAAGGASDLERDPALVSIGQVVHYLDAGRHPGGRSEGTGDPAARDQGEGRWRRSNFRRGSQGLRSVLLRLREPGAGKRRRGPRPALAYN